MSRVPAPVDVGDDMKRLDRCLIECLPYVPSGILMIGVAKLTRLVNAGGAHWQRAQRFGTPKVTAFADR